MSIASASAETWSLDSCISYALEHNLRIKSAEIERILARFRNEEMEVDTLAAEVRRATEMIALCRKKLLRTEEEVKKILEP